MLSTCAYSPALNRLAFLFSFLSEYSSQSELATMIRRHRDDEEEHKDIGLSHHAEQAPLYQILTTVVKTGCKTAIWLSERV